MDLSGQRVLVTGADGFIGSHLAEALVEAGADVRALVFYNSFGSHGWLDHTPPSVKQAMEVVPGDIRDTEQVERIVRGCSVVFHLAALISVPYSYEAPRSFVDTNIHGTLNVLEAAREQEGTKVIQTSTSEVYGTPMEVPISEMHQLRAQSPYAATKIAADKLAESYHSAFGVPVVTLRPFNTYGPRQSTRAVLPVILTQILAGRDQIALGSLWPSRDFTYVDDTVQGFIRAAMADQAVGRVVQLGTGRGIAVGDLAELAMKVLGRTATIASEDERVRPDTSEVEQLLSDPSLARRLLGWAPTVSLEEGIRRTADWLSLHLDDNRVGAYVT